jgi:hypothetical protein
MDINEFMELQNNLLLQQLELLNDSPIGKKILRGAKPKTVEEFRRMVPLTDYEDYCPELLEKREDVLPTKPEMWAHSSGRAGDYPCKWIPLSPNYVHELSKVLYGIGMISCANHWGDVSHIPINIKLLYGVAPRPYISGTFADVLRMQSPFKYIPDLEKAENMPYEKRIAEGFQQALNEGVDYFFGLALVLAKVGEKLRDSSSKVDIRQYLSRPMALFRLVRGLVRSRLAHRPLYPKDIWSLKGIISSGVDSSVYKKKIQELWGKTPIDIYSCTEGGVIATQIWDYEDMSFIPHLNFFEFIPEDEILKWQMDRSYKMKTLLLDEVQAGQSYEIVITSLHGGSLVRYRIGDMIKITSLRNKEMGVSIPQMVFDRRVSDIIDFVSVRFTEKLLWQTIESSGIPYTDWVAHKLSGDATLRLLIECKENYSANEAEITATFREQMGYLGKSGYLASGINEDWRDSLDFDIKVTILPPGTFARLIAKMQAQGVDLAHLKVSHINPSERILSLLLGETEETIVVTKKEKVLEYESEADKVPTKP